MNHEDDYIYNQHKDIKLRVEHMPEEQKERLEEGDLIEPVPAEYMRNLEPGDSFDLGGETIEIYGCYEENLHRLQCQLEGTYDTVYISHGDGNAPKNIIREVIEVCEDIRAGRTDDIPFEFGGIQAWIAKAVDPATGQRADGKKGNIVYNRNKVTKCQAEE